MKIVIRSIQVITGLTLLFLSIGMVVPSFSYETTTTVDADKALSYQVFTDASQIENWLTGFESMEKIKGGLLEEGSQWKVIINKDGQTFEMVETIITVKPNEQFSFVLEGDMMTSEVDVFFETVESKTQIRTHNKIIPNGLFWKSIFALMQSTMQEEGEKTYQKLALLIEKTKREGL